MCKRLPEGFFALSLIHSQKPPPASEGLIDLPSISGRIEAGLNGGFYRYLSSMEHTYPWGKMSLVDGVSLRNGDVKHHFLSSKISILL